MSLNLKKILYNGRNIRQLEQRPVKKLKVYFFFKSDFKMAGLADCGKTAPFGGRFKG